MPRYLVERPFPDMLDIPLNEAGARVCQQIVEVNATREVTWLQSFVSQDKKTMVCLYEAPSPEAIRSVARKNQLPVTRMIEVTLLDPYFYR